MKAAVKELLKEFQKSYTKYDSVNRWKNKLTFFLRLDTFAEMFPEGSTSASGFLSA